MVILANEPYSKSKAEILSEERWWIINVILFPRDQKTGWPVRESEPEAPTMLQDPRGDFFRKLRAKGLADWVIAEDWERRKQIWEARYGRPRSERTDQPQRRR